MPPTDKAVPAGSRRRMLQLAWASCSLAMAACGGSGESASPPAPSAGPTPAPTAAPTPAPTPAPGSGPSLGAHTLAFHRHNVSAAPLVTAALTTAATGSVLLAGVGRGDIDNHRPPTDNKGNTFVALGSAHPYTQWPGSGTALYGCVATGGANHVFTAAKPSASDETTLTVVEVRGAGRVQDLKWNEVLAGQPLTSLSVTTTGPALLVAWWWGDAPEPQDKTAVPNNGFVVVDAVLLEGALVQCAVATRQVSAAGTYNVTWVSTPLQGAQLWLAAVQA